MKSNLEIRQAAWQRLFAEHWFGILLCGAILLGLCGGLIKSVASGIVSGFHVLTLEDALMSAVRIGEHGGSFSLSNLAFDGSAVFQIVSSLVLDVFFSLVVGGIVSFGVAALQLQCLSQDRRDWLKNAFGGFARPLDLAWLQFRLSLVYIGWSLLGVIPLVGVGAVVYSLTGGAETVPELSICVVSALAGAVSLLVALAVLLVPFYRYRFLFLVKAEHPELGAGECMRTCRELMKGHALESFRLDCSYWRPITLLLVLFIGIAFCAESDGVLLLRILFMLALLMAALVVGVVLGQYLGLGQAMFYEEIKGLK